MKKVLLSLCIIATTSSVFAQVKTPKPSPAAKIEQTVGLTEVTVAYSRPSAKGRKIFNNLVPYGKIWRTGANANTKITFSDDITIDGKSLAKGTYALYTKPNANNWEVFFYSDSNNWGNPKKWDATKVALSTTVKTEQMPMHIETFTISIDDLTNDSALIGLFWENTYAGIKIKVPTDEKASKSITKTMNGPSARDYYNAAAYYLSENKNMDEAKIYIDKAVAMTKDKPLFYFLRRQSLIYAKTGDKKGAIKAAKASLEYADKAKNADYVKMNKDSLKEWGAM